MDAWSELIKTGQLGERQLLVLKVFTDRYPNKIPASIAVEHLGRGVSEGIRNRITELVEMGYLEKKDKDKCPITGRMVNYFQWTGRTSPKQKQERTIICPHCHGSGRVTTEVFVETEHQKEMQF
jgi:hypothetical protein